MHKNVKIFINKTLHDTMVICLDILYFNSIKIFWSVTAIVAQVSDVALGPFVTIFIELKKQFDDCYECDIEP